MKDGRMPPRLKATKADRAEQGSPKKRRPKASVYTPALGKAICKMLASGMSLNQVCKRRRMPYEQTVRGWAKDPEHPFAANYVRAREVGYLKMADEILEIADDSRNDYVERENKDGSTYIAVDHDHIARARLRVEVRKWMLAKALPKIFGDKPVTDQPPIAGGALKEITQTPGVDHMDPITRRYRSALKVIERDVPANAPNGKRE